MDVLEIFLLAVGSMFWPTLLVVVVIALRTSRPVPILAWFWAGGVLTAVGVGAAIVFSLQDSDLLNGSHRNGGPWIDIVAGTIALFGAVVVRGLAAKRKARAPVEKKQSRSSQQLERLVVNGGPLAFAAGILATFIPGPLMVIGMADIAQLGWSVAATVGMIVAFYLVMFTFVEGPLVGLVVAPKRTSELVAAFNAWLDRNLLNLVVQALLVVGAFELVRGIVTLIRR